MQFSKFSIIIDCKEIIMEKQNQPDLEKQDQPTRALTKATFKTFNLPNRRRSHQLPK